MANLTMTMMMMSVCEKEVCLSCAGCEVERRERVEERRVVRLRELSENSRSIREREIRSYRFGGFLLLSQIFRVFRKINYAP